MLSRASRFISFVRRENFSISSRYAEARLKISFDSPDTVAIRQELLCPTFWPQRINSRRFSDRAMPIVTSGLAMPPVRYAVAVWGSRADRDNNRTGRIQKKFCRRA
jgi:hypothetical protein